MWYPSCGHFSCATNGVDCADWFVALVTDRRQDAGPRIAFASAAASMRAASSWTNPAQVIGRDQSPVSGEIGGAS